MLARKGRTPLSQVKSRGASKLRDWGRFRLAEEQEQKIFGGVAILRCDRTQKHRGTVPGQGAGSPSLLRCLPARLFFLLASSTAWDPSATATKDTCGTQRKSRDTRTSAYARNTSQSFTALQILPNTRLFSYFCSSRGGTCGFFPRQSQTLCSSGPKTSPQQRAQ